MTFLLLAEQALTLGLGDSHPHCSVGDAVGAMFVHVQTGAGTGGQVGVNVGAEVGGYVSATNPTVGNKKEIVV